MGVDGIWAECKAVVRTVSLTDWAIEQSRLNGRPTVVGIDTPNMIDKILASSGVHERMHGDGAIGSLISSILQYTEVPATFVFAFDADSGGDISHKAGKKVVNKKIPFYNTARRFIKSIGGHIVNGPGEADIQLAMLSQQGYVDAVISDDGDMIVHNIGHVLRYNKKKSKNCGRIFVDEYCASDVQRHLQLRSPADLLLIAVLVGNSYDRTGLKGCGMKTALELARCGLGEVLVGKFKAAQSPGLVRLEGWKAGLKFELETNSSRKLSGRNRALASRVQSFDPRAALSAYLKAIRLPTFIRINSRNGHPNQSILKAYNYIQEGISFDRLDKKENPGTPRILTLNEVHIHSVRDFCITYMHWDCAKILQYFARKVWAGVIIQMLHSPFLVCDGLDNGSPRMPKSIHTPWHKAKAGEISWFNYSAHTHHVWD
ncbi:hypothetical protein V5O48_015592 [Marasmius crinis-equi]|uniref:XPG-I domain-containing protein n=1 Tax=Marasmius crinis-equi TaxID=585013 RepID=A0ABR3EUG1_9AGAR